jgi:hypothetical protein
MESGSLNHYLEKFCKKAQLIDYCDDYDIPVKTAWTKTKLAAAISEKLLLSPEILIRFFSQDEFILIQNLIASGGSMISDDLLPFIPLIGRGLTNMEDVDEKRFTITLAGDFMGAIAPKMDAILSDQDLFNQTILDLFTLGLVNIYGILPEAELARKFNHYSGARSTKLDIMEMILLRDKLKLEIKVHDDQGKLYYHSGFMVNPAAILKEIRSRKTLEYAHFHPEEIMRCGTGVYIPGTKATAALRKELEKRGTANPDELIRAAWMMTMNNMNVGETIHFFSEHIRFSETEDFKAFFRILTEFVNTLPLWILKGNSPHDVFQTEKKFMKPLPEEPYIPPTGKTIRMPFHGTGRNDPCPCGSGKKYKHCCGRV